MTGVCEAPKLSKSIRKLQRMAAENENFCQFVCDIQVLVEEQIGIPIRQVRQALRLALFEAAWDRYRAQQGTVPVWPDEADDDAAEKDDG